MRTLVIETSAEMGSVAVLEGAEVVAEETFGGGRGHASLLFPVLDRLLGQSGDIDQILCGVGPGGYSGIRVGVSAAIGLKIGRNLPAIGIFSVLGHPEPDYRVVMDARGAWIFAEVRDEQLVQPPILLDAAMLETRLSQASGTIYRSQASPLASVLGRRFALGFAGKPLPLAPVYLKPPHITKAKTVTAWGGTQPRI
ncbi:MAG TPA: tRNA (adenosine(37)-N6)-threonylcarbamoyltransferase complex dimerization subunit type 1 TsaB [Chthoniobacterales bacterium]